MSFEEAIIDLTDLVMCKNSSGLFIWMLCLFYVPALLMWCVVAFLFSGLASACLPNDTVYLLM